MRRRILFAIVATVALSLALAGTGTYLLLGRQADRTTETNLRAEAEALSGLIGASRTTTAATFNQRRVVRGLRLEGISVVNLSPAGQLRGDPPEGVTAADLPTTELQAGHTVSGRHGQLVWAAASLPLSRGGTVTVILTRSSERPDAPLEWFLVGSGLALAVAGAVAWGLSGSLTRPLRDAHGATSRIAEGDLAARLPEPPATAHDEVADLTRSINAMAAALEQSRGLERQFLLSVSHDLRTPLTSIRGYAEAIADGTAPVPADAARVIGTEANRLGRLVADLLDLARLDAAGFRLELQIVPVAEVVTETSEGFRPAAEAAGLVLHVGEPGVATPALIDPDRLAQAIANLVENGLKYAASQLWVHTQAEPGGGTRITVADDGPGIASEDLAQIFERLYVAERRPARGVGGSGLGLAIVRELVTAMGGTVHAESPALANGSGARFVVVLPPPPDGARGASV